MGGDARLEQARLAGSDRCTKPSNLVAVELQLTQLQARGLGKEGGEVALAKTLFAHANIGRWDDVQRFSGE
jgi:hypothetical protein